MILENNTIIEDNGIILLTNKTLESTVDPTIIFGPRRDSLFIVIPITVIYAIIFVTGLVGNLFTCIVIIRNKSMHTATNYYLFSLAISDLLLLVSGMPQEMYSIWSKWPYVFGAAFCLIRGLAAETSTNASILTITLFTIERYLAICHPFQSHKMSKLSRATKHVVLLWVAAFALALPQALQFGLKSHKGVVMCLQTRVIMKHSFEISTFVFFLAPIVLITVLYFLIGIRLHETSKGKMHKDFVRGERVHNKITRRHSQSTRRVVKMLVAVVVAFFICWAPFHAQRLVAIYGTTENHLARSPTLLLLYSILTYVSGIFYYISTCINPILYHIMCYKFRVAFKNTLVWCCHSYGKARVERLPSSTMVFARVPTSSGSDNSGNNSSRNETTSFYKKAPEIEATKNGARKFPMHPNQRQGAEPKQQQDCGGNFCHHKFKAKQAITRRREENQLDISPRTNYEDTVVFSDQKNTFWTSLHCSRYPGNSLRCEAPKSERPAVHDSISNSSLKESKHEDLEDELTSYLQEIRERVLKCENEYK